MKNKLLLTLLPIIMLNACSTEPSGLKILAPAGAPAIALYSYSDSPNLTTTTNPKEGLIPMFQKGGYDIIIAPTNGGLAQIKQGAKYKIAATITFGNFYILSSGRDLDGTMNAGDKIVVFQQNDIPGKMFNYLYGGLDMDITYVAGAEDTKSIIENNYSIKEDETTTIEFDYVFTAQPVVTVTNSTIFANVQNDFATKSGNKLVTQASIFVNNNADKGKVDEFLKGVENDIKLAIENPALIKENIEKLGEIKEQQNVFGVPGAIATRVTAANNGFSLGYRKASDIKNDIENFVNLLTNNTFGELSEEVFYQ